MTDITAKAEAALKRVIAPDGSGIYASDGILFNHTIFARDACMSARWLLELRDPQYYALAKGTILTLAALQGVRYGQRNEEEPGRILNQYKLYARWRDSWALRLGDFLVGLVWGGNVREELTYIGVDSTPLFVLLVCEYAAIDATIWEQTVERRDGRISTIRECVAEAVDWLTARVDTHGLVARRRHNPLSLFFGSWRDSFLAYVHPDGRLASLSRPIVYLEVQVLTVDALRAAAAGLARRKDLSSAAKRWRSRADELAATTLERFWFPEHGSFVMALETARNGQLLPIVTPASSASWILDSTLLQGVAAKQQQEYVTAIVRQLSSSEFLTKAGIRARANGSDSGLGVADYHGSWTVWAMDTYKYARGLRRQGLPQLADAMERRLVRAVERGGNFYEFFLVSPAGEVLWRPHAKAPIKPKRHVNLQILPERTLTWTITACVMIGRQRLEAVGHEAWRHALETEVLDHLSHRPERPQTEFPFAVRRLPGGMKVAYKAGEALLRDYVFRR